MSKEWDSAVRESETMHGHAEVGARLDEEIAARIKTQERLDWLLAYLRELELTSYAEFAHAALSAYERRFGS